MFNKHPFKKGNKEEAAVEITPMSSEINAASVNPISTEYFCTIEDFSPCTHFWTHYDLYVYQFKVDYR